MSTLHSTLPSLSVLVCFRGRPSLAPSFASIAIRHGFSTSAMDLAVKKRASAASSAAKLAFEKAEPLHTRWTQILPVEGRTPRKELVRPHKVALTSYRHLFQTRDRWLAHQLAAGVYIPPRILSRILSDRKILAADMAIYVDVLSRKDVYYAMERLGLLESAGPDRAQIKSPDWLILAIPGMLRTIQDVPYLASMLVRSQRFAQLNRENRAVFIARCLQSFLRIRHLVAVRETIDWVCSARNQLESATAFARVLTVLAAGGNDTNKSDARLTVAPRELLHRARDRLLESMKAKGIEPTLDTTLPLLEPGLIPDDVHETAELIVQITRLGYKLKRGVLRRAMMALIAAGNEEGAKLFAQSIEGISSEDGAGHSVEDAESIFDSTPTACAQIDEGFDPSGIILPSTADPGQGVLLFQRLIDRLQVPAPGTLPKSDLAEPIWARLFNLFSRSSRIPAQELQNLLRQLESSPVQMHDHTWRRVYHGVMLGLLSRQEPERVVRLWDRVTRDRSIPLGPDSHMLDVVMRAYCSLGRPDQARGICDAWTIDLASEDATRLNEDKPRSASETPPRPKRIKLDVLPLNNLMLYYSRTAAYGETYALFKAMQSTYGVVPNSATLTILIESARYASFHKDSVGQGTETTCSTSQLLWDNQDPVCFVEDLVWSVLEQNWPDLAQNVVVDPFKSKPSLVMDWILSRSSASATKSMMDANGEEGGDVQAFNATLSIVDPPRYPYLHPSARTFRSFILLVGSTRRYEKIPLVLAWMKALHVRPSRHTLGLAMMYVAEMAYADERMVKWRMWVRDWVGEDEVPREEEIAYLRRGGRGIGGRKE
ncbi:BQ2448_6885 [Microbotryum intermedium]|uniref:BQ2448_6885 protein n=1 Tax=Microbotryum intermedium TaxID=269621 RepID=A0A238FGM8_9BASI|nr:BQ2448_6885 [Microbotryum intermedium]